MSGPSDQPPHGAFGAPKDPWEGEYGQPPAAPAYGSPATPPPQPGYGPTAPPPNNPYPQQPGPYGAQPQYGAYPAAPQFPGPPTPGGGQSGPTGKIVAVVASAVAAVLLVGGLIAYAVISGGDDSKPTASGSSGTGTASSSPEETSGAGPTTPAHVSGENGTVIVYGDSSVTDTVKVYEEPRCPYCGKFETTDGKTLEKLADDGKIKIEYHLATFLDNNLPVTGSKNAVNALGAALNEGVDKFMAYHEVLYANQPSETQNTFADNNELLKLADEVDGLKTAAFTKAVTAGTYNLWADAVNEAFSGSGVQGTPTVYLNDNQLAVIENTGNAIAPAALEDEINKGIAG